MLSAQAQKTIAELRRLKAEPRAELEKRRAEWQAVAAAGALPQGTVAVAEELGGVPSERVTGCRAPGQDGPQPVQDACVLLLHGGGYVSGCCVTHREMAARLSAFSGVPVWVPDYRLAPEHPFPAATDDCLTAYHALLNRGIEPSRIVLCGDSAGGGLAVALMMQLRDLGLPLPAGAVLLSPWLDLEMTAPSVVDNAESDPSITRDSLAENGRQYIGSGDSKNPLASPCYGDPRGLPPLYIDVGDLEVLLDDSLNFAKRAEQAGCEVVLHVACGMWHVYPAWASLVPEAMEQMKTVAAFVRETIESAN